VAASELSILDVAPMLLTSLGLPVPLSMEGRLPSDLLTAAALPAVRESRQPERYSATVNGSHAGSEPMLAHSQPVLDKEEENEILRRLQALGYVE
jgi:hypothetical protein